MAIAICIPTGILLLGETNSYHLAIVMPSNSWQIDLTDEVTSSNESNSYVAYILSRDLQRLHRLNVVAASICHRVRDLAGAKSCYQIPDCVFDATLGHETQFTFDLLR